MKIEAMQPLVVLSLLVVAFGCDSASPPTPSPSTVESVADSKYEFTEDWTSRNTTIWMKHLGAFVGKADVKGLEIGSFEGRSSVWFLENILTHPKASITCIDPFLVSSKYSAKKVEDRFDANMAATGVGSKVRKIAKKSEEAWAVLEPASYDFIYVDGSHTGKNVFLDAALSWNLLKVGGVIIFDDYAAAPNYPAPERPRETIDTFLQVFEPYIEILHKDYQVIVKKIQG